MIKAPTVAICVPVGEKIDVHFWESLNYLRKPKLGSPDFPGVTHVGQIQGRMITDARRQLTLDALVSIPDLTHILWIDDDMSFPHDALQRLLAHDKDIVGGLCHNRRPPYQPILARLHDPTWGFAGKKYGWCYTYPQDTVFEVDATGAAFLLVKREVFDAISEKHGSEKWWSQFEETTEDFSFCIRAKECGFSIFVDTGLEIGHWGTCCVDADFSKRNREFEWDAWHPMITPKAFGEPRASIVIPTYDQQPELLLAAVKSALSQTVPTEVIVVDDGSKVPIIDSDGGHFVTEPDSMVYAKAPEQPALKMPPDVRVLRHPTNRGIAEALNTGIKHMRTEWFCWLSSDDLLDPRKVELQQAVLVQSNAKAGYHPWNSFDADGNATATSILTWANMRDQRAALAQGCVVNGSTVMIHKSVFNEVGLFDPEYKYGQDWEMWCRIGQRHLWLLVKQVLASRREHGNLTEALSKDPARKQIALEEDARIRAKYRVDLCPHCQQVLP